MKNVVEVSADIAMAGLYATPDIWFYAVYVSKDNLLDDVQNIIHATQPLTSSYAAFGDNLYEKYHRYIAKKSTIQYGEYLMTMASFTMSRWQINAALQAIVEVAIAIHMKTINSPDDSTYPRVIPHELDHMRFDAAWKINRDAFHQMFRAEPWASWIELMRGQVTRNKRIVETQILFEKLKEFKFRTSAVAELLAGITRRRPKAGQDLRLAKRAIKRAVKLHDRLYGVEDIRKLIGGYTAIIYGRLYDYHLTFERGTLFSHTTDRDTKMSPTWMEIRNKSNIGLGTACLYYDDTAVLDYLLNIKLQASNWESELDMIKAFHITKTTSAFFRDPVLPELKGIHDPVTAPLVTIENIMLHATHDKNHDTRKRIMEGPFLVEARAALNELLRLPNGYLNMLDFCSNQSIWNYLLSPSLLSNVEYWLAKDLFA